MDPRRLKLLLSSAQVFFDYLGVILAFYIAYHLRGVLNDASLVPLQKFMYFAPMAAIIFIVFFSYLGLYTIDRRHSVTDQLIAIFVGCLSSTALLGSVIYFGKSFDYSRLIIGFALIFSTLIVWLVHGTVVWIEQYFLRQGIGVSNTLLIGFGDQLKLYIRGLKAQKGSGVRLLGIILTRFGDSREEIEGIPVQGVFNSTELGTLITENTIHEVVLADTELDELQALDIINVCELYGVAFKYVPDIFDVATARIVTYEVGGTPIIELKATLLDGWNRITKRVFDLLISSIGLIALSPVFLLFAVFIKLDSKGPVFFKHRRAGRGGGEFDLVKFRSMAMVERGGKLVHAQENAKIEALKEKQPNYKLEHDPRVTRVGRLMRKTSIDELPQLWNVLRGEMSLVGPRAYLTKELEKQQWSYPETKGLVRRLLTVKPGVTGLWQVSGRSNISFTERVAMDAYYATHANILMDFKLLLQTGA